MIGKTNAISGGGSQAPTTLTELMTVINDFCQLQAIPSNQPTYMSNTPVTLYTPAANFTKYFIRYRDNQTGYNIVWLSDDVVSRITVYFNSICLTKDLFIASSGNAVQSILPNIDSSRQLVYTNTGSSTMNAQSVEYYMSGLYATEEEAIAAIQNSNTTYTYAAANSFNCYNTYLNNLISNIPYLDDAGGSGLVYNNRQLSSNETIEVIV